MYGNDLVSQQFNDNLSPKTNPRTRDVTDQSATIARFNFVHEHVLLKCKIHVHCHLIRLEFLSHYTLQHKVRQFYENELFVNVLLAMYVGPILLTDFVSLSFAAIFCTHFVIVKLVFIAVFPLFSGTSHWLLQLFQECTESYLFS